MQHEHKILRDALQSVLDQLPPEAVASFPPLKELLPPLHRYWQLLQKWNAKIRLTGASNIEEYAHRHIADSMIGWWALYNQPPHQSYLDIGAGAGFPSIPLALLRSDLTWTLVESHSRRAAFLQQVQRELKLSWVQTKASRITGQPDREKLHAPYNGIVFRAVAPEQILPIAHHYLSPEAQVIYWGTSNFAPTHEDHLNLIDTFQYKLPGGEEFSLLKFQVLTP